MVLCSVARESVVYSTVEQVNYNLYLDSCIVFESPVLAKAGRPIIFKDFELLGLKNLLICR